jgi:integrase
MASISHDEKTGRRVIQFTGSNGKRQSFRLGKCTARQAETAKIHVENLLACLNTGSSPNPATADWVADLPELLRKRAERVGLIGQREHKPTPTLGEWLRSYIEGRGDVKEATATVYGHTRRNLLEYFGETKRLGDITPGDVDAFRIHLNTNEELADNTIRRRLGIAKQFVRAAIRKKLLVDNPFDGQSTIVRDNPQRFYFVTQDDAQAVLTACPSHEWKLIFALCRYGGLRCPTEVMALRWADIDWANDRFTVHASKTEHHDGGGIRLVPIFPELLPYLRECFEQAVPGSEYVIEKYRGDSRILRTMLGRIIKRAGLIPWQKLFQNLRSTRETELVETFPVHVVTKWLGNSPAVANKHYLQVTDEHYKKAVQNPVQFPVQQSAASGSKGPKENIAPVENPNDCGPLLIAATSCESNYLQQVGDTGLGPVTLRV